VYIVFFLSSFLRIPKSTTVSPTIGQGPIVELEQAKCAMEMVTGAADRQGSKGEEGEGEGAVSVGDWWLEGGMGVIDAGETAVVHVGKTLPSSEPSGDHRTVA
jgi:hypothetical protein